MLSLPQPVPAHLIGRFRDVYGITLPPAMGFLTALAMLPPDITVRVNPEATPYKLAEPNFMPYCWTWTDGLYNVPQELSVYFGAKELLFKYQHKFGAYGPEFGCTKDILIQGILEFLVHLLDKGYTLPKECEARLEGELAAVGL